MWRLTLIAIGLGSMVSAASAQPGPAPVDSRPPVVGTASARRQVVLHAPIDGILRELAVREGARVEEGTALARMDDRVQRARVAAARAASSADGARRAARLRLAETEHKHERTRAAHAEQAAADWELEAARMHLEQARAAVEQARERHVQDTRQLEIESAIHEQYTLRAPFSGVVTEVHFDEGASLKRSDTLIEVVSLAELEAEIFVPGEHFGRLAIGERYALKAGAPVDSTLSGEIASIDPILDPASGTFRVVLHIDNADGALPAGFSVELGTRVASSQP